MAGCDLPDIFYSSHISSRNSLGKPLAEMRSHFGVDISINHSIVDYSELVQNINMLKTIL